MARVIAAKAGGIKSEAALEPAAAMMAPKSAAVSEAPPTSAPSTLATAKIAAALPGLTEPP